MEPPGPATLRHSRCTRRPPLRRVRQPAPAPVRHRSGIRPASGPVRIAPIFLRNASVWRHSRCRADGGWLAFGRDWASSERRVSYQIVGAIRVLCLVPAKRQRGHETARTPNRADRQPARCPRLLTAAHEVLLTVSYQGVNDTEHRRNASGRHERSLSRLTSHAPGPCPARQRRRASAERRSSRRCGGAAPMRA